MASNGGGKIGSLRRNWSTVDAVGGKLAASSSQPAWEANQDEWPSSPPNKKTKSVGSLNLGGPVGGAGGGWRNNGGTRDSGVGIAGGIPPPAQQQQSSFAAASGGAFINRPKAFGPSASTSQALAAKPVNGAIRTSKKREFPWDAVAPRHEKKPSASSLSSGAFHSLKFQSNGPKMDVGGSKSLLSSASMSIASKVTLSPEQRAVLNLVLSGQSVFFTGSAGTGKSVLLRQIIRDLRDKYSSRPDAVAVTASTGMAACNVGGTTIHSFAGIGLGREPAEELRGKVYKNRKASGRWKRTKVIVVDEVSMVDGDLFDKLEYLGRKLKGSEQPFGGIQLVVTGDFFQLPPVTKGKVVFAFDAKSWKGCVPHMVNLTQVFRQSDTTFIDMLNEMRMGRLSGESIERFKALKREPVYNDGIDPTELYPMRNEVENSNQARLRALPGVANMFEATDSGKGTEDQRKRDLGNMMAVDKLVLKVDAQVMMIKNMTEEGPSWLVNGAVGKVVDFVDERVTIVEWKERYAMGLAGPAGAADFKTEAEGDEGDSKSRKGYKADKRAAIGDYGVLPVVKWYLPNGSSEFTVVSRAEFKVENAEGEVQSRRIQLPLILAWAMSIHKSQGQTLSRVKVDLGRVFEKGQSYVALSRATSMEGLQVLNFQPGKVNAHPAVVKWSQENLTSALM